MPFWIKYALKTALRWLLKQLKEELEEGIVIRLDSFSIRIQLEKEGEKNREKTFLLML